MSIIDLDVWDSQNCDRDVPLNEIEQEDGQPERIGHKVWCPVDFDPDRDLSVEQRKYTDCFRYLFHVMTELRMRYRYGKDSVPLQAKALQDVMGWKRQKKVVDWAINVAS